MEWCKKKVLSGNKQRLSETCCNLPMARSLQSILWESLRNPRQFIPHCSCPLRHTPRPFFIRCTALWGHEWNRCIFTNNAQWRLRPVYRGQEYLCTFLRLRLFCLVCKFKSILCKLIPPVHALSRLFCTFMKSRDRLRFSHLLCKISRNS